MAQEQKIVMVSDLPALEPVMEQVQSIAGPAKHVAFEDFLKLFDEGVHGKIRGSALGDGVTHVVCFQNIDMWSSQLGRRTSMIVGSKQTYTLEKILRDPSCHLGDVPSRFQYPVAYASVASLKVALPGQEKAEGGGDASP